MAWVRRWNGGSDTICWSVCCRHVYDGVSFGSIMKDPRIHTLHILSDEESHVVQVPHGANLRRALLDAGFSPYTAITRRTNCGGRGLCATCGVWIEHTAPSPHHWHDRLAARFGYPRLSCQISICADMTVRIVTDKLIWGHRDPTRRSR